MEEADDIQETDGDTFTLTIIGDEVQRAKKFLDDNMKDRTSIHELPCVVTMQFRDTQVDESMIRLLDMRCTLILLCIVDWINKEDKQVTITMNLKEHDSICWHIIRRTRTVDDDSLFTASSVLRKEVERLREYLAMEGEDYDSDKATTLHYAPPDDVETWKQLLINIRNISYEARESVVIVQRYIDWFLVRNKQDVFNTSKYITAEIGLLCVVILDHAKTWNVLDANIVQKFRELFVAYCCLLLRGYRSVGASIGRHLQKHV